MYNVYVYICIVCYKWKGNIIVVIDKLIESYMLD